MKRLAAFSSLSVALGQLVFSGVALAQANPLPQTATVRAVHGTVEYSSGDQWLPAKANLTLNPGAAIKAGADSSCDLQVNGRTSTVRITAGTTLILQKMTRTGEGRSADTETILDLKTGTIMGSIKKISAGSSFTILTPNGTAQIRGTEFQISAEPLPAGGFRVTFTSLLGAVYCSANVGGKPVTMLLTSGQSWTTGKPGSVVGADSQPARPRPPGYSGKELRNIQQMAGRYNSFGFQLLNATRKSHPKENIFISPLGAGLALSILQHGAQGPTLHEITHTLGFDNLKPAEIGSANKMLLGQLASLDENIQLAIANSLWVDHAFSVNAGFISQARDFYDAEVATLDFGNPASVGEINSWASRKTRGTIPAILKSLNVEDALVAVDAVYFKGLWVSKFLKTSTSDKPFKLAGGAKISHPRMSQSGTFDYYETRSFQLISLPYGGGATMNVLLPEGSLDRFLKSLNAEDWQRWISAMHERIGLIDLPRFKLENEYDFKAPLASLGVRQAFDQRKADFSQIGDADLGLYVSEIQQKSYVDVDEEGIVAAAVTSVLMPMTLGFNEHPSPPPFQMIVDHPFFVVIREDSTGAILFMGAILDPR